MNNVKIKLQNIFFKNKKLKEELEKTNLEVDMLQKEMVKRNGYLKYKKMWLELGEGPISKKRYEELEKEN